VPKFGAPNQYHLTEEAISVAYFPEGMRPVTRGGPICLVHQDAAQLQSLTSRQIRVVSSARLCDAGRAVTAQTVDVGSTNSGALIPDVRLLAAAGASAPTRTVGITAFHRTSLACPSQGQQETEVAAELTADPYTGALPA
jgi:hypothetical protein